MNSLGWVNEVKRRYVIGTRSREVSTVLRSAGRYTGEGDGDGVRLNPVTFRQSVSQGWSGVVAPRMMETGAYLLLVWKDKLREWHRRWVLRVLGVLGSLMALHVALNIWMVPRINENLPNLSKTAGKLLKRPVQVERVKWVAPTGVFGLHSIARLGGVSVGSGEFEKSHGSIKTVDLNFDPLGSILRGRLLFAVKSHEAVLHLKQASNFSWFGFPDDTTPSSRFVPPKQVGVRKGRDDIGLGGEDMMRKIHHWHHTRSRLLQATLEGNEPVNKLIICSVDGKRKTPASSGDIMRTKESAVENMADGLGPSSSKPLSQHVVNDIEHVNKSLESLHIDLSSLYSLESDLSREKVVHNEDAVPTDVPTTASTTESLVDAPVETEEDGVELGTSVHAEDVIKINNMPSSELKLQIEREISKDTKSSSSFKFYRSSVQDPGTERRKTLGSKALQKARNWKPAKSVQKMNEESKDICHDPETTDTLKQSTLLEGKSAVAESPTAKSEESIMAMPKVNALERPTYTPAPLDAKQDRSMLVCVDNQESMLIYFSLLTILLYMQEIRENLCGRLWLTPW